MTEIKIIATPTSWIEGEAVRQLHKTAELPGMIRAIGMPDLHPGQGYPCGAVFVTEDIIYPALIGSDIGCGMGLWTTTIKQTRPERLEKKFKGLETGVDSPETYLEESDVAACGYEHSLGTLGRGNHFAELLMLDDIVEIDRVNAIIDPQYQKNALLLVHSGSRGFGKKILHDHTAVHHDKGLRWDSEEAEKYLAQHHHAMEWAELNRSVIADRILDCLGSSGTRILDIAHNFMDADLEYFPEAQPHQGEPIGVMRYIHRKGAIPSNLGPVIIPGSRGAHSYLVEPTGDDIETGKSLSHGAGRKMSRQDARLRNKDTEKLVRTSLGSHVICEDKFLLQEEAPEAYKPIGRVINDLVEHKLIRILAILKPILTYKMRRTEEDPSSRRKDNRKPRYAFNEDTGN